MSKENKTKKIFRVEKDKNFSVIKNTIFLDERLSWGAKGVLAYALTKPDDWDLYISEVVKRGTDKKEKVSRYFKELRQAGYFEYKRIYEAGKICRTEYIISEQAKHSNSINIISRYKAKKALEAEKLKPEILIQEKLGLEILNKEKTSLINTDSLLNTDNNKILTIVQQLKDFAKENNLSYEINPDEDRKSQSKLVTQLSLTNEQVLKQVERLKPILADSKCDWWSKTNSFGFNYMLKNWGRIDSWHNANKPKQSIKVTQSFYEPKVNIPTDEELARML